MMNHTELKRLLRAQGIGGLFGRGIRLFDQEYYMPTNMETDQRVRSAMARLSNEGLVPQEDYAEDGADCDNWAILIWAEVMKQWIKEHKGMKQFPAYPFGFSHVTGHAIDSGPEDGIVKVWDYGILTHWDLATINEVNYA